MGSEPTITKLISQIETQFGKGAIMCLDGDNLITDVDCISSGSRLIDQALGVGGYPRGRIIEIYGPESSGKTTLCLHAIAEAQRVGGIAAFIDAEHAFDPSYAANLKVDVNELLLSQPDSGEQALQIAEALTRSGVVDLVVVDSVAALTPRAELEGQMGDTHVGLQARLMSQALRKLTAMVNKTDTTIIFINQLRHKIGVMFGSPETTPGGNALKFYSSVRMDVRRIGQLKSNQGAYGSRTRVKVVKNKLAPPFQIAEFDIRWGEGIDRLSEMIDEAREAGVITKRGAYLYLDSETLGQGKEKARLALQTNTALYQALCDALDADAAAASEPQPKEREAPAAAA